ncbi:Probable ATP synthase SpaL [Providencia alcalifaciens]|nr:Probable ATP synthase SpaL [Providencia alcalifaciens]
MKLFDSCAHPVRIHGCLIEAPLDGVFIGEICFIEQSLAQPNIIAKAQVIGFKEGLTVLSLIGRAQGLTVKSLFDLVGIRLCFKWVSI